MFRACSDVRLDEFVVYFYSLPANGDCIGEGTPARPGYSPMSVRM